MCLNNIRIVVCPTCQGEQYEADGWPCPECDAVGEIIVSTLPIDMADLDIIAGETEAVDEHLLRQERQRVR